MKKLLKKAMVFTLAAAMLVGTPLTASAAPLNSVFSVSDHWGNQLDDGDDKSHTGTISNTMSTSNSSVLKDNETKIIGIALDKKHVDVEVGGKRETLTATIITDMAPGESLVNKFGKDATEEMLSLIMGMMKWQVQEADGTICERTNKKLSTEVVVKGNASQIVLNPREGTKDGEDLIVKCFLDGTYYFTPDGVREDLVTNKTEGYSAEATVSIKEYSKTLYWEDGKTESDMYLKHTLDLGDIIRRDPETANDTITWTSTDTKIATVSSTGVVTAKKIGECTVIAVGERKGAKVERKIKVVAGFGATSINIFEQVGPNQYNNLSKKTWSVDLNNLRKKELLGQMYVRVKAAVKENGELAQTVEEAAKKSNGQYKYVNTDLWDGDSYVEVSKNNKEAKKTTARITDIISWSSNKTSVATVKSEYPNGSAAVLTLVGPGTAKITAKTTSGKSMYTTVKVTAELRSLKIEGIEKDETLYSGQSVNLTVGRDPVENKDAVKWDIEKVTKGSRQIKNPNAKISSKGVLTISNKIDPAYSKVTILLESKNAKDAEGNKITRKAVPVTINVAQSSINGITIKESGKDDPVSYYIFKNEKDSKKDSKSTQQEISVPLNKTFEATVAPGFGAKELSEDVLAGTLKWTASGSNKIVEITGSGKSAKIKAKGAGTSTITVSGIRVTENNKASVIKTTFKVKVKQPVESVTFNKPSVVLAHQTQTKKGVTTTKSQKVALKVTLGPKGANKNEAITWSVSKTVGEADGTIVPQTGKGSNKKDTTKTSATFTLVKPEIGDEYTITAKTASGATATSVIRIVKKTQGVQIAQSEDLDANKKPVAFKEGRKNNAKNIEIGDGFQMFTFVNVGKDSKNNVDWELAGKSGDDFVAEDVTYSVSKKGIVSIDKDGNVFGLKKGTVTITAKTPMNKKATLKVTVK